VLCGAALARLSAMASGRPTWALEATMVDVVKLVFPRIATVRATQTTRRLL
jgi:hypothetical protein